MASFKREFTLSKSILKQNKSEPLFNNARYSIYLFDKDKFGSLIYPDLKNQLDAWIMVHNKINKAFKPFQGLKRFTCKSVHHSL